MLAFVLDAKKIQVVLIWLLERSASDTSLRIFGGRDVEPEEFPYVVRMTHSFTEKTKTGPELRHMPLCTGAAIAAAWTLTAAHCVSLLNSYLQDARKNLTVEQPKGVVIYKSVIYPETESSSDIISTHKHSAYKNFRLADGLFSYNDVALLKTTPMRLEVYGKVNVADYSTLVGQRAHSVGYGLTNMGDIISDAPSLGKMLQVMVVVITKCEGFDRWLYPIICLSRSCKQRVGTLCNGDSGGPLILASGIAGVNAVGISFNCKLKYVKKKINSNLVGAITPISPYVEWIADHLKKDDHFKTHL